VPSSSVFLSVCLIVCHVHILSKQIMCLQKFFTFGCPHHSGFSIPNQTLWQYSDGDPPNGDFSGVGKNRNCRLISAFIMCCRQFDRQLCVIHTVVLDHGKLVTLVAGKQRRLSFTEDDKKPQRYAKTTEQHLIVHIGKSETEVTNSKRLWSRY